MFGANLFANTFKVRVKRHTATATTVTATHASTEVSPQASIVEQETPPLSATENRESDYEQQT
jgi:hypothetical protein